jgi:hypothetical protein
VLSPPPPPPQPANATASTLAAAKLKRYENRFLLIRSVQFTVTPLETSKINASKSALRRALVHIPRADFTQVTPQLQHRVDLDQTVHTLISRCGTFPLMREHHARARMIPNAFQIARAGQEP